MAKRGRKREAKVEAVTPGRLKSFVERIARVLDERDEQNELAADILQEAKSIGYDVPTLRKVVKRHRMNAEERAKAAEQEALIETYEQELNMAVELVRGGMSLRAAEKATGVPKSNIHRALSVPVASHDEQTGEITDSGVEPPEPVATGQAPAGEGQPTDTAAGSPVAPLSLPTEAEMLAAMDESRERWNDALRRART